MLTWNKENLWNYHVSLCTGERLKIVISCHLTISLRTHSCNETLSHISHIQLQHWKLWQQHNAHIDSTAHCTYPLSYIAGDTDQCFLLSTVVFGSIESFPKHRSRERCSVPLEIFQNTDDRRLRSDFTLIVKLCSSRCKALRVFTRRTPSV